MRKSAKTFQALSDPNRLRILKMLEVRPLCVCEIQSVLNLAASTVSKHLSILRDAGFLTDRREHKWVIYSLDRSNNDSLVQQLQTLVESQFGVDEIVREDKQKVQQSWYE